MYKEINLPIKIKLDVNSYIKIVRVDSLKNIVSLKSQIDKTLRFYSKNTEKLYLYLEDFTILKTLNNLKYSNLNILFDVNVKNITLLKQYKDFLNKFNLTAILDNSVKQNEVISIIQFLALLKIKSYITFDLFKNINEKEILKITKEIVLDPQLIKDVEPFYSFVEYIYKKRTKKEIDTTLWDSFKDRLDRFSYLTNDGFVTLSKRWDKRSRYLYNIEENKEKRHNSEFYKELSLYEQNLFFKNLECAMCDCFEFCGAYLKFEDSKFDCTPFQTMLKNIDEEFDIFKVSEAA